MAHVLVTFDSPHGSTAEVAQTIADTLRGCGHDVHLGRTDDVDSLDGIDAVVIGAPVYVGRWSHGARALVRRRHAELAVRPVAVFALGPLHDDEDEFANARRSVEKGLAKVSDVRPRALAVFGGALDPAGRRFPASRMEKADIRDWDAIRTWARSLPELLEMGA